MGMKNQRIRKVNEDMKWKMVKRKKKTCRNRERKRKNNWQKREKEREIDTQNKE